MCSVQDDGVDVAKAAAQRALLSTIPDHVMRELEQHAAEAKAEAEKLKVRIWVAATLSRPSAAPALSFPEAVLCRLCCVLYCASARSKVCSCTGGMH